MIGRLLGNHIREKYFPEEGRVANLEFDYSPEEIEQLRSRNLPAAAMALVTANQQRHARRNWMMAGFALVFTIVAFGIVALAADVPSGTRLAVFLIGVGFCLALVAVSVLQRWYSHGRHAKATNLRVYTAPAVKGPDRQTVRFGGSPTAPDWTFPYSDARTLTEGTEYTVYHVHDVLVYLEEALDT